MVNPRREYKRENEKDSLRLDNVCESQVLGYKLLTDRNLIGRL